MLEGIKEVLRRKVEAIAERIYWDTYRGKVLREHDISGVIVRDASILNHIMDWCGKIDPMARFALALTEIGISLPVEITDWCIIENETYSYYRVYLEKTESKNQYQINLKGAGSTINVMQLLQEDEVVQKVERYSFWWSLEKYVTNNLQGMQISYGDTSITINGFLGTNIYMCRAFDISKKENGKTCFQHNKEIVERLENSINEYADYINDIEDIKVYEIYNRIVGILKDFYHMEQASVVIEMLGISAQFTEGKLTRYTDDFIKMEPYSSWIHKEYQKDGKQLSIYNGSYKISGVKSEEIQNFMKEVEKAFAKIERLDF